MISTAEYLYNMYDEIGLLYGIWCKHIHIVIISKIVHLAYPIIGHTEQGFHSQPVVRVDTPSFTEGLYYCPERLYQYSELDDINDVNSDPSCPAESTKWKLLAAPQGPEMTRQQCYTQLEALLKREEVCMTCRRERTEASV